MTLIDLHGHSPVDLKWQWRSFKVIGIATVRQVIYHLFRSRVAWWQ